MQPDRSAAGGWRRPQRLDEALASLRDGRWTVLAGGTDLYAGTERAALAGPVLDISAIESLRGLELKRADGGGDADSGRVLRIGALASWSDLIAARLPQQFDALTLAAPEIGGAQIQNRGTVGGNLCNASPAADGTVALLALDAEVEVANKDGVRSMPLAQFVHGPRRTALAGDELLVEVRIPVPGQGARSTFLKLGHRRYLVISIAMVAVSVAFDAQRHVARAAIAVGACAPTAVRLAVLEQRLAGVRAADVAARLGRMIDDHALEPISPIDDVRATGEYRREAVVTLIGRAFARVCTQ